MVVLFIDDFEDMRSLMAAVLEGSNVRLLTTGLGAVGVQLAQDHRPDLIILDLYLPDMGGEAVFSKLQADERTRSIPVVVFSGDALRRRRATLLGAGVREYLVKPLGVEELRQLVERYRP
jgi:CheY-like chemotaxis protein